MKKLKDGDCVECAHPEAGHFRKFSDGGSQSDGTGTFGLDGHRYDPAITHWRGINSKGSLIRIEAPIVNEFAFMIGKAKDLANGAVEVTYEGELILFTREDEATRPEGLRAVPMPKKVSIKCLEKLDSKTVCGALAQFNIIFGGVTRSVCRDCYLVQLRLAQINLVTKEKAKLAAWEEYKALDTQISDCTRWRDAVLEAEVV